MEEKQVQHAEAQNSLFDTLESMGHEQVVFCSDPATGLKAIIGVHSTVLGPALGGCRFWHYHSEAEALRDVLRLSRGMTMKNAIAGLNLGGGKAVIIGDPAKLKTPSFLRRFGQFVESLSGRYITAEDVGMNTADMEVIYQSSKHVTGLPEAMGGSGDPSPFTAYGVFLGAKAAAKRVWGSDSLAGKKVALQGAGHVGTYLARHLKDAGAQLYITDYFEDRALDLANQVGATVVGLDEIYDLDVDIYAPCALGGTLNTANIKRLKCAIVNGAANNQLEDENLHGQMLTDLGISYSPDFLINSGGVINVYQEILGYDRQKALEKVETIYDTLSSIFAQSTREGITTHQTAKRIAMDRVEQARANA